MASIPVPMAPATTKRSVPPLHEGDRLTRAEFRERYEAMPEHVKAERLDGRVYVAPAAVSAGFHGDPHAQLITWLGVYQAATPGVIASDNSTVALEPDSDPQPDASLRILPSHGGRTTMDPKKYIDGALELAVEVAASSADLDLGKKFEVYQLGGIRGYVVHCTYESELHWFVLRHGKYVRLSPDADGIYRSEVFPGLWLSRDALIAGQLAEVLAVLQRGTASAEHAQFVEKLEMQRKTSKGK